MPGHTTVASTTPSLSCDYHRIHQNLQGKGMAILKTCQEIVEKLGTQSITQFI